MARFFSNPGSPLRVVRESYYDSDGALCLRDVGTDNIDEFIQSYAGSADIVSLARRCMLGDTSVLRDDTPMYIDNVGAPKSPIEMLNVMASARSEFDKLPVETRSKYDNDFNKFFVSLFSGAPSDEVDSQPLDSSGSVVVPSVDFKPVGGDSVVNS